MDRSRVAVRKGGDLFYSRSLALAGQLGLPCLDNGEAVFWLEYGEQGLWLRKAGDRKGVLIDWLQGKMDYRIRQARSELLVKAFDVLPQGASVLDATAGFATDSVLLALAGFSVTACERSPVLHALQHDAWLRAQSDGAMAAVLENLHLRHADALAVMQSGTFDAIYLDPMFPARDKSAAVKKPMVYLQDLLGEGCDGSDLLVAALQSAKRRVVVKRPPKAPFLAGMQPSGQRHGKAIRFDIYSPPGSA
ncbi:MAG: hypothetical protein EP312_09815 [Gammaproteobacteria bacterium]|nr:MAG: hypothetical protein EP312_09815 [Gammaproteobacteria bacterium]